MFWRARSPLEPDDEAWQIEAWAWLLRSFGGIEDLRQSVFVLPTPEFFALPASTGHDAALDIFGQVAWYLGSDGSEFELVAQEAPVDPVLGPFQVVVDAPVDALGTFSCPGGERMQITYSPKLLSQPAELITTLAHELCHPLLLSVPERPPGGDEMEEFATDLAVTFTGFGIFNANAASRFVTHTDHATGAQGWRFEGGGYLSPAERAFALALFLQLTDREPDAALPHLDSGPAAYFRKAVRYLAANPGIAADLRAVPAALLEKAP